MQRRLIVVAAADDEQAIRWYKIAGELGSRPAFLSTDQIFSKWHFEVSRNGYSGVVLTDGTRVAFEREDTCWYYRGPTDASIDVLSKFSVFYRALSEYSYPLGNYFQRGNEEAWIESKPLQHSLLPLPFPPTYIVTTPASRLMTAPYIVKSLSGIRSIAVRGSDRALSFKRDLLIDGPTQFQRFVRGVPIKVHFYRTRRGTWNVLAIAAYSPDVDYRYTKYCSFEQLVPRANWCDLGEILFEKLGCLFFDVDLVESPSGLQTFLEVNLSPAPVFYEARVASGLYVYSARVLADWLDCSL